MLSAGHHHRSSKVDEEERLPSYRSEELQRLLTTNIFSRIAFTHLTADSARHGIEETGKILAPSIALERGFVPFSGEYLSSTYLFRHYHVSVSSYPQAIDGHNWRRYLRHGMTAWSPKESQTLIDYWQTEKERIKDAPYRFSDFENPGRRRQIEIELDGCIALEEMRQKAFDKMTDEQRKPILSPRPDLYVFDSKLGNITSKGKLFGKPMRAVPHPFVPGEINLRRYLLGMFTSHPPDETSRWIAKVIEREVPVGSFSVLEEWEELVRNNGL